MSKDSAGAHAGEAFFGPHVEQVGRIAIAFGQIEMWVNSMLMQMMCGNQRFPVAVAAVAGDSITTQLDRLNRITPLMLPQLKDEVALWVSSTRDLNNERNAILHAAWAGNPEEPEVGIAFRLVRKQLRSSNTYTIEELRSVATRMEAAAAEISELYRQYLMLLLDYIREGQAVGDTLPVVGQDQVE